MKPKPGSGLVVHRKAKIAGQPTIRKSGAATSASGKKLGFARFQALMGKNRSKR